MRRRGATFLPVWSATVISLLTVALTASLSVRQRTFDEGVSACFATISIRDPKRDAATDIARGERRFFFNGWNEWNLLQRHAVGVVVLYNSAGRPLKGCVENRPNMWRKLPFDAFSDYMVVRHGDPFQGSADPIYAPRTACGKAEEDYIRAYNTEMARLNPSSMARYCK